MISFTCPRCGYHGPVTSRPIVCTGCGTNFGRPPDEGVGTELRILLKRLRFKEPPGCKCPARARLMNQRGIRWCEQNRETIIAWLKEEAVRQEMHWGVIENTCARAVLDRAIKRAKKQERQRWLQLCTT